MAMIELSLMDNSCEAADERHEGIRPEMFVQAVKMLDFNYVDIINYSELAEKGIERCRLLAEVLRDSKKDLAYRAEPEQIGAWAEGLTEIEKNCGSSR